MSDDEEPEDGGSFGDRRQPSASSVNAGPGDQMQDPSLLVDEDAYDEGGDDEEEDEIDDGFTGAGVHYDPSSGSRLLPHSPAPPSLLHHHHQHHRPHPRQPASLPQGQRIRSQASRIRSASDPLTQSYRESLYRKDAGSGGRRGGAGRRRQAKGRSSNSGRRRQRLSSSGGSSGSKGGASRSNRSRKRRGLRRRPQHSSSRYQEPEELLDEELRGRPGGKRRKALRRRKKQPQRVSKNYVYVKKNPGNGKQGDGSADYDVAYARGNYQAVVDEYDSDTDAPSERGDRESAAAVAEESSIIAHMWTAQATHPPSS